MPPAAVLVSACLLGAPVRYHGGDAQSDSDILRRWQRQRRIVAVCPEVAGGLPTPRPPAELQGGDGVQVLRGGAAVRTRAGEDVTEAFRAGAAHAVAAARGANVRVAVLKSGSPSCAVDGIYDGTFSGRRTAGAGVTAAALRAAGVQVFDETQLAEADAALKEIDGRHD
ncbi:MAG TPA: DUF523 domain-containing protein [Vicinamibacterales bacterium]|nr:DUF523 domain-containing protein [Vicinamibacterales bacterium]